MKAIVLIFTVALSGCVAPSSTVINSRGEQKTCASAGFGWLGAPVALGIYADCMSRMEATGYKEIGNVPVESKVQQIAGIDVATKVAFRPVLQLGEYWYYDIVRSPHPGTRRHTERVEKKDLFRNTSAYVMKSDTGGHTMIRDENLNLIEVHENGQVTLENIPVMRMYSWPLKVGDKWNTSGVRNSKTDIGFEYNMDVEVKGYGYVSTPAGQFEAFYITARGANGGALASEIWYSPTVRGPVKLVNTFREGVVESQLTEHGRK
jgi:hypothetical protein